MITTIAAIIACANASVADSPMQSIQKFDAALASSLPRCFPTTDHATMAKALSSTEIRCEPHSLTFGYDDPTPMKILCMVKENFRDDGNAIMQPPLVILVVDHA